MANSQCIKCRGMGEFELYNDLTGNIIKVPCLCPLQVSIPTAKLLIKKGLILGIDFTIEEKIK